MEGIGQDTVVKFQQRVARFSSLYVADWAAWLETPVDCRAQHMGEILRRWQACRPNRMRRTQVDAKHDHPFLEDLVKAADPYLAKLADFNIANTDAFTKEACEALFALWEIFQKLSYQGKVRNGQAGAVGISKAVLLLSRGRIGPAFDSKVRLHLGVGRIDTAEQWVDALRAVSKDLLAFELNNAITLAECVPQFAHLEVARIYDMALGPGGR